MDLSWEYINRSQTHDCKVGTEAAQFLKKEEINGIFVAMQPVSNHLGLVEETPFPQRQVSDIEPNHTTYMIGGANLAL